MLKQLWGSFDGVFFPSSNMVFVIEFGVLPKIFGSDLVTISAIICVVQINSCLLKFRNDGFHVESEEIILGCLKDNAWQLCHLFFAHVTGVNEWIIILHHGAVVRGAESVVFHSPLPSIFLLRVLVVARVALVVERKLVEFSGDLGALEPECSYESLLISPNQE